MLMVILEEKLLFNHCSNMQKSNNQKSSIQYEIQVYDFLLVLWVFNIFIVFF